jgi:hypothetical protein
MVGSDRPPIVPLVIYHGAREWTVPLSFGKTVAADPALRRYLPDWHCCSENDPKRRSAGLGWIEPDHQAACCSRVTL